MTKRVLLAISAFLFAVSLFAQVPTGGVKGKVIDRNGRDGIENARLILYKDAAPVASALSAQDGSFAIQGIRDGMYTLVITAPDFLESQVQVTVVDGYVKNMFNLSLTSVQHVTELDDDSYAFFDMDGSGFNDNPTILFGSNDVFNNLAGYNFSSVRFRARGYSSESQDVYLAGVKLNDAITGYGPFSLWSGLNEAMRSKETVNGAEVSDFGMGGYNGLTNIFGTASQMRKGLRGSVLTNSAMYRMRVMGSYATGMMDNGWALAVNVSARLGGNDWIDGVYYRSLAYYLGADKELNDHSRLSFVFFATPGERGAQNASTQEVYDLVGDNMYNSNWGYQNGKVRNARVRKTNEPIAFVKWETKPSDKFNCSATILYRFGKNGYTALDWYDAQDPRPDYYRNLPSYFYGTVQGMYNDDLNRNNPMKNGWSTWVWQHSDQYPELTHINWDRLYNVNYLQNGRSKYIQEERHVDQRDLNFAYSFKYRPLSFVDIAGGLSARINNTEYYKVVADLLGGKYFIDIDNFAEREFASTPYKLQNDLDYYLANGTAKTLVVGDKYGYDYMAKVRNFGGWISGKFTLGKLSATAAGRAGFDSFWREGLVRKGLFPGKPENDEMAARWIAEGIQVTEESSYGKSKVASFLTYAGKLNLNYIIGGNRRMYANVGYFADAPKFNQVFLSPRTRNSMMADLTTVKTFSSDVNWQYSANGVNVRATAYYTTIKDQSKVMSAYDDLQNAFSNFALSGIDQRNMGVEFGFKFPTYIIPNLSLQGVLAFGDYIYTSTPVMTQTVDNNADIISYPVITADGWATSTVVPVRYWSRTVLMDGRKSQHYVPSTPQTAVSLGFSWNHNYWFVEGDVEYFDRAYLDMNPLYRTDYAVAGLDNTITNEEIEYMTTQEKFAPAMLLNASVGKSWFIQRKYQLGFSFNAKNLMNNRSVKTGGYEQTRLVDNTVSKSRFYRFDPKFFYMPGSNYMLNVYFRF
ncbi:MAG: carboxypeptidase regulatory-like domain-containing protein [Bacteroidales bacterium]|nr:carboxypeptidase regulatory-like domain-containing protein [Bacteroidales bacterium]